MPGKIVKIKSLVLVGLLCAIPFHTVLAKKHKYKNLDKSGWIFGLDAGYVKPSLKKSASVLNGSSSPAPNNSDLYTINNPNTTAEVSGYAGYRFVRNAGFLPAFTVAGRYQHIFKFTTRGMVQQYSLPAFTNYNYNFDVSSDVLTLQGKADLFKLGCLAPYLSAGIGIATNKFGNYTETATSGVTARLSPAYANRSLTNATYNVGAGIDFRFNRNFSASVNYEYADLGTVKSGRGEADNWTGEELQIGLMKAQLITFSLFYQLS